MANIYYDQDVDIKVLDGKVIAVIGYGNQGRSQALNLKDSGVENVIVGSVRDQSWTKAKDDGFEAYPIEEASKKADIIFMTIPDEIAPGVYDEKISPNLEPGNVLNFASGYNIVYKNIQVQEDIDVVMVAPRMVGEGVRELYENKEGFPSFVAVEQDASGQAKDITLALAKAIGSTKKGAIEVTFKDETHLDLFAEQITWPLILSVFTEVYRHEVDAGYPEEAVLMELYLSKEPALVLDKMAEVGLFKQLPLHSNTSQYGQLTRFQDVDKGFIRDFIHSNYEKIKSGEFSKEWSHEQDQGLPRFKKIREEAFSNDISQAETKLKKRLN